VCTSYLVRVRACVPGDATEKRRRTAPADRCECFVGRARAAHESPAIRCRSVFSPGPPTSISAVRLEYCTRARTNNTHNTYQCFPRAFPLYVRVCIYICGCVYVCIYITYIHMCIIKKVIKHVLEPPIPLILEDLLGSTTQLRLFLSYYSSL